MGKKVPPANDGSNYYSARKFNDPEKIRLQASSPSVKGIHLTEGIFDSLTLTNENWTFIGSTATFVSTTAAQSGSLNIFESHPLVGDGNFYIRSTSTFTIDDPTSESREKVPDHEWVFNDLFGVCTGCSPWNRHRYDRSAHPVVIQEDLTIEDWREQLVS